MGAQLASWALLRFWEPGHAAVRVASWVYVAPCQFSWGHSVPLAYLTSSLPPGAANMGHSENTPNAHIHDAVPDPSLSPVLPLLIAASTGPSWHAVRLQAEFRRTAEYPDGQWFYFLHYRWALDNGVRTGLLTGSNLCPLHCGLHCARMKPSPGVFFIRQIGRVASKPIRLPAPKYDPHQLLAAANSQCHAARGRVCPPDALGPVLSRRRHASHSHPLHRHLGEALRVA